MQREIGPLEAAFLSYAQMRGWTVVRTGDVRKPLRLTADQERNLLSPGFLRMSEDLDFAMPTEARGNRTARRRAIAGVKELAVAIPALVPGFGLARPVEGHNSSRQYDFTIAYRSTLDNTRGTIEIEVALREPLLSPVEHLPVHTAVRNWLSGDPLVEPFALRCLSYAETMAEKLRAALCRREVATTASTSSTGGGPKPVDHRRISVPAIRRSAVRERVSLPRPTPRGSRDARSPGSWAVAPRSAS